MNDSLLQGRGSFSSNFLKNKKCNMRKTRNDIETNDKSEKKIFLNELMI